MRTGRWRKGSLPGLLSGDRTPYENISDFQIGVSGLEKAGFRNFVKSGKSAFLFAVKDENRI